MKIYPILKAAKEMDVDRTYAISCRERFLTAEKLRLLDEIDDPMNEDCFDAVDAYFTVQDVLEKIGAVKKVDTEMREIYRLREDQQITDEMIERSRQYPVNQLIEFHRGKAKAWCHEDRNPSMYYGNRKNVAVCPVCDKKFGPIDILMQRDGYSFKDAVKALC